MSKEKNIWNTIEISSEVIDEKDLFTRVATAKEEPMFSAKISKKTVESKLAMQTAINSAAQLLDAVTNGDSKSDQQTICLNILFNLKKVCEDIKEQELWVDNFYLSSSDFPTLRTQGLLDTLE